MLFSYLIAIFISFGATITAYPISPNASDAALSNCNTSIRTHWGYDGKTGNAAVKPISVDEVASVEDDLAVYEGADIVTAPTKPVVLSAETEAGRVEKIDLLGSHELSKTAARLHTRSDDANSTHTMIMWILVPLSSIFAVAALVMFLTFWDSDRNPWRKTRRTQRTQRTRRTQRTWGARRTSREREELAASIVLQLRVPAAEGRCRGNTVITNQSVEEHPDVEAGDAVALPGNRSAQAAASDAPRPCPENAPAVPIRVGGGQPIFNLPNAI